MLDSQSTVVPKVSMSNALIDEVSVEFGWIGFGVLRKKAIGA